MAVGLNTLDHQGISTQVTFNPNGEVAAVTVNLYPQEGGVIGVLGRIQDQP